MRAGDHFTLRSDATAVLVAALVVHQRAQPSAPARQPRHHRARPGSPAPRQSPRSSGPPGRPAAPPVAARRSAAAAPCRDRARSRRRPDGADWSTPRLSRPTCGGRRDLRRRPSTCRLCRIENSHLRGLSPSRHCVEPGQRPLQRVLIRSSASPSSASQRPRVAAQTRDLGGHGFPARGLAVSLSRNTQSLPPQTLNLTTLFPARK